MSTSLPDALKHLNLHGVVTEQQELPTAPPPTASAPPPAAAEHAALTPEQIALRGPFLKRGRPVWLPVDDEDAWVIAAVERSADGSLLATRQHAPRGVPLTTTLTDEVFATLAPATGVAAEPVDDLTQLETISTGAVLHTLRQRYAGQRIYTSVGPIVLAVNPFAPNADCTAEKLTALALEEDPDALPPHVFNVARSAYTVMLATGGPQAILVSGESGAGKTETAKLCMASLAQLSASPVGATQLALQSGLLLEAFGNAKTTHNDNSSRFGKWVEIHFAPASGAICACAVVPMLPSNPGLASWLSSSVLSSSVLFSSILFSSVLISSVLFSSILSYSVLSSSILFSSRSPAPASSALVASARTSLSSL